MGGSRGQKVTRHSWKDGGVGGTRDLPGRGVAHYLFVFVDVRNKKGERGNGHGRF